MENSKEQLSQLELNIKALEKDGIKVKHMSGFKPGTGSPILQLKDFDSKKGIVAFYFSAFGNKDSDGDILQNGAFTKTIKENFARIKHLKNHDRVITPGVIKELHQDEFGAYAVSQLVPTVIGKDTLIEYEHGIITEHSMGFGVMQEHMDKGTNANIITEVKLWEVSSLNAWGANMNTPTIGVKDEDIETLIKNIEVVLKSSNISDERGKELELKLTELLTLSKKKVEAPIKKAINWDAVIKDLKN